MAWQEFYCNPSTGSNMNGGTDENTSASYATTNGNWNGTDTFTPTDGSTPASTVTVGQYANIFNDGSTTPVYCARVTAVAGGVNGAITLSTTAKFGTAPTSSATARSINVGGVWKGPNAAVSWPIGTISASAVDGSSNLPRVNFKNNATYSITATMTGGPTGPMTLQGYTTTPGDLGKATFDGGNPAASFVLLDLHQGANSPGTLLVDLIFQNNGTSGTGLAKGVVITATSGVFRCVFHDIRGSGCHFNAYAASCVECEFYNCNTGNNGAEAAAKITNDSDSGTFIRCFFHDNGGSEGKGIYSFGSADDYGVITCIDCVFDTNQKAGIQIDSGFAIRLTCVGCEFYNNGIGILSTFASNKFHLIYVENSNFVKQTTYGISSTADTMRGFVVNCGFPAAGTTANGTANTNGVNASSITGTVTYTANTTPWVDPANGDFRLNVAAAKQTGRGAFTQTAPSYAGTVAYPDIGAAEHLETAAGGLLLPRPMGGGLV